METLNTYNLLFPPSIHEASQTQLKEALKQDPAFAGSFSVFTHRHEVPRDARRPENVDDLYRKFPHWGERLDLLWKEIENPTPVTAIERWTDKRKSASWNTWWVVLGLGFAVLFGFAATGLGAVQVWISYCSWMDNPMVHGCSFKSSASSQAPPSSSTSTSS